MKKLGFIGLIIILLLNIASICSARYMGYYPNIYYWMRDVDANDHELFNVERIRNEDELNLVVNAYYDEDTGNWYRIDESKKCWRISLDTSSALFIYYAVSGTGAITWSGKARFHESGELGVAKILKIRTFSQATEPEVSTDEVALWIDTDDNRWWFIWDRDGTQYKVGFENASGELQWTPVWEEQRAHITQFYKPGTNYPAEGEIGVTPVLLFDATNDEEIYYEWAVPDNYDPGSDIKLRFAWAPTDASTGDVVWATEYTIVTPDNDEVLTVATTTATVTDSAEGLTNELLLTDFITISGTGVQAKDTVSMRIYRDADADDYGADAALVHLGLYFQVDRNGVASP